MVILMKKAQFVPMFRRATNVPKGSRCVYCGGWAQVIEHVIPDLKPFPLKWNERYACAPCNIVKARKQQRKVNPKRLLELLKLYPSLDEWLGTVPVGMESKGDDDYNWYYRRFKPSLNWLSFEEWDVVSQVALALYEADIPIRESLSRYANETY